MLTYYRITLGLYWLSLGIWLGAMVMLAVAAGVTFRTVATYQPTIGIEPYHRLVEDAPAPGSAAPAYPLHTRVLAGAIVGNILKALTAMQVFCAAVVVACLVLQNKVFAGQLSAGVRGPANVTRMALIGVAIVILAIEAGWIAPEVWRQREVMYDPGQPSAARAVALVQFNGLHRASTRLHGASVLALAGAVLASAFALHAAAEPKRSTAAAPATASAGSEPKV